MANTLPVTQAPGVIFASSGSSLSPETCLGVADFFEFNDWNIHGIDPALYSFGAEFDHGHLQNPVFTSDDTAVDSTGSSTGSKFHDDGIVNGEYGIGKEEKVIRDRVAFRTKSQIEILDDGFKWRKYGKKMVKNSPNPRNYFKCSVEGCPVKKRVERDKDDPHYVVTTYEGIHIHQGPYL
ncbi:putative WRKY transcription factor 50-like [Dorcoceras hygrometricum]|uniref:Putative WRKY transcription factor 50-like n=1 Tax=Dorcoceras hygrometricum TaxID=472368 RepID=A0A2Z7CYS6_9LAMI|nr:putative WRKY transcription factor 50-like [Dorcoceras hygrometricum]